MAEGVSVPQRGIAMIRTGIIAIAALALAACQTVVPRGPDMRHRPPPVRVQQAPSPIREGIPTDNDHQLIALLVPLTGPNGGVGRSLANATQLALLDTNNVRVRVTTYDTNLGAAAAAQRAIAEGNRLILGPLLAADVRAAVPVARGAGVPVLSFSNDTGVAGDGAYVLGYTPAQSIARVVDYARSQGMTSFTGLMPNGLYGDRAATAFLRSVEEAGGKVVSLQTYGNIPTLGGAVTRLSKTGPYQAVLIADGAGTAATAAGMVHKSNGSARVLGTELWNSENAIGTRVGLNGAWFASVSDGLYRQYAAKYRARFGTGPYRLSSMGYDAVLLTIRIARDWPVGAPFPEGRLHDREGFSGIDGAFRFGRDNVAERALEVQEIRGGTVTVVSPAPSGFGAR
ncbi:MAG: penicillin-binding protein activator [Pseudomonadota bacterium]|nr:penicillin-binding protein activator [Pseudomonadota bacterium]